MSSEYENRLERIEDQLTRMADALALLARIDERMLSHIEQAKRMSIRQEKVEVRVSNLELSRARWLGAIAVISAVASFLGPLFSKFILG